MALAEGETLPVNVEASPLKALPGEALTEAEEVVLAEAVKVEEIVVAVVNAETEGACAEAFAMVAAKERRVCPASSFFGSLRAGMTHVARSSS